MPSNIFYKQDDIVDVISKYPMMTPDEKIMLLAAIQREVVPADVVPREELSSLREKADYSKEGGIKNA